MVNLIRQYLKDNGRYEEFLQNVENDYAKMLGNESVQGGNVQFALPNARIKDDGKTFAYCDSKC